MTTIHNAHQAELAEQLERLRRGEITEIRVGSFTSRVWDEDAENGGPQRARLVGIRVSA